MKRFFSFILLCSLVVNVSAQKIPSKKKIVKTLRLTNQYFMDKWPDAGKPIFTNIERPSNIWTRAVYYEGLMALYKIDKKKLITIICCNGAKSINGAYGAALKQEMQITSAAAKPILICMCLMGNNILKE